MELKEFVPSSVRLSGFSPVETSQLVDQLLKTGSLETAPGDFTMLLTGTFRSEGTETAGLVLASSPINVSSYYWCAIDPIFIHGPHLQDVAAEINKTVGWKWNNRALGSLLAFGHTIGMETLHSAINRLPAASVLLHMKGKTELKSYKVSTPVGELTPEEILEAQDSLLKQYLLASGARPALALTAGLGSRSVLAAALHYGLKPVAYTFGSADSADVRVARQISRDFFLEHRHIDLTAKDLFHKSVLRDLASVSGGIIRPDQLVHAAFLRKAHLDSFTTYFSSLNAECVYGPYGDSSVAGLYRRLRGSKYMLEQNIKKNSFGLPKSVASLIQEAVKPILSEVADFDRQFPLGGYTNFMLHQKARHDYGMLEGIYGRMVRFSSPFTDRRYTDLSVRLPVRLRKNNLFQRRLIRYFFPGLMDYEVSHQGNGQPIPLGTAEQSARFPIELFSNPDLRELIIESKSLDEWFAATDRERLLKLRHVNAVSAMLTIAIKSN